MSKSSWRKAYPDPAAVASSTNLGDGSDFREICAVTIPVRCYVVPHVKLSAKEIFDASQPLSAKISGSWQEISAGMEGEKPPCQAFSRISPSGAGLFAGLAWRQRLPVHPESGAFPKGTEFRFLPVGS